LTLEAVAREAGLSKGGVLYHFATKEALIQAMIARLIQYCEQEIEQQQRDDTAPGRWTRAYVRKTVEPKLSYPGEADFPKSREVGAALIVTAAINPKLLEPLRERFRAWQQAIERDGIGPTGNSRAPGCGRPVVWPMSWDMVASEKLRRQVLNELIRLTRATGRAVLREGRPS
jgi:AcrR family transcriptional regulator